MAEFIVTSGADEVDGPLNAADGLTLREAIMLAEAAPGADTIRFAPDVTGVWIERAPASPSLAGDTRTAFTGYTVASDDGLVIDGDIDGDGVADVALDGGFTTVDDRLFITRISGSNPAAR